MSFDLIDLLIYLLIANFDWSVMPDV